MKINKRQILYGLGLIGGIGITGYLSAVVIPQALVTMTKAAPASKVSIKESYLIGEKLLAEPDGKDNCVVNVFVLDSGGRGVAGKRVVIEGVPGMKVRGSVVSGNDGRVTYEGSSLEARQYTISASIEGIELDKTVKCTFRE